MWWNRWEKLHWVELWTDVQEEFVHLILSITTQVFMSLTSQTHLSDNVSYETTQGLKTSWHITHISPADTKHCHIKKNSWNHLDFTHFYCTWNWVKSVCVCSCEAPVDPWLHTLLLTQSEREWLTCFGFKRKERRENEVHARTHSHNYIMYAHTYIQMYTHTCIFQINAHSQRHVYTRFIVLLLLVTGLCLYEQAWLDVLIKNLQREVFIRCIKLADFGVDIGKIAHLQPILLL